MKLLLPDCSRCCDAAPAPYRVGFTGTSKGMISDQAKQVRALLMEIKADHPEGVEFHFGLCIGADEQAAIIAENLGCRIVAHPGYNPKNPKGRLYRSDFRGSDEVRPEKPFLKRDHDIVDETDRLIATPLGWEEEIRSGTWATVRYARKKRKPINIVYREKVT